MTQSDYWDIEILASRMGVLPSQLISGELPKPITLGTYQDKHKKYYHNGKGKETQKRYDQTEKGKERWRRYYQRKKAEKNIQGIM